MSDVEKAPVRPSPLPSVEEVLGGETQGGVPRPTFLDDHEDDSTVDKVERP